MPPKDNGVQVAPVALPASAFSVAEGKFRRRVTVHQLQADKLEVVVVVDTDRGATNLEQMRAAAATLVQRLPSQSKVSIVSATATPHLLSPLTSDRQSLGAAVGKLESSDGEGVVDGVRLASHQFSSRPGVRRTIVLLTASFGAGGSTIAELSDEITKANISTYVIRTNQSTLGSGDTPYPLPSGEGEPSRGSTPPSSRAADRWLMNCSGSTS